MKWQFEHRVKILPHGLRGSAPADRLRDVADRVAGITEVVGVESGSLRNVCGPPWKDEYVEDLGSEVLLATNVDTRLFDSPKLNPTRQ